MRTSDLSVRRLGRWLFGCAFFLLVSSSAWPALVITLSGTPDSSIVNVSLSGSSTVARQFGSVINFGWSFPPMTYDPFPAAITGSDYGVFGFVSGAGEYRNITRNQTSAIVGVWLQDSSNSPIPGMERFGISETRGFDYVVGDVYEWSGSGTIDLAAKGLTFGSLRVGTTGPIYGELDGGALEGQLVITAIPEPAGLLAWLGGLALIFLQRRSGQRRQ